MYNMLDKKLQISKYGEETDFLFAVGDGNHSLATAKEHWKIVKQNLSEKEMKNHPARFALVELENLHDDTLEFEPIHRIVFNGGRKFIEGLRSTISGYRTVEVIFEGKIETINANTASAEAINQIQNYIDDFCKQNAGVSVEYVHGRNYLEEVSAKSGGVG
jgi:hypothetical protein